MELFGKIIVALPERSGTSARGNQWRSITYVLETQEQYPKKLAFDVVNEKIDQFNIQVGEMLNVQFDINAREYNQKWFNSVQAWNVQRPQPGGQQGYQQPQGGYKQGGQQWSANNPAAGAQAPQQAAQQAMRSAAPNGQPFPPQPPQHGQAGQSADSLPF